MSFYSRSIACKFDNIKKKLTISLSALGNNEIGFYTGDVNENQEGYIPIDTARTMFLKLQIVKKNKPLKLFPDYSSLSFMTVDYNPKDCVFKWSILLQEKIRSQPQILYTTRSTFNEKGWVELNAKELSGVYFRIQIVNKLQYSKIIQKRNNSSNVAKALLAKDFKTADEFNYKQSPNTDGNRSRNELFGGTGSNMKRTKGL
jgi:hypothetical protein